MSPLSDQPLRRELLSDQAYAALHQAIASGELRPGDRLVESEIARRLGVSQAPVRDSLRRLVHEGLATHSPRRGTYVSEISQKDADDARQVRSVLEELAARMLAGRLPAETDRELSGYIEQMRTALSKGKYDVFRDLDIAFHKLVCTATGNVFLPRMWQAMEPSMRLLHAISNTRSTKVSGDLVELHESLLELLRSGDPDIAGAAFAAHACGTGRQYLEKMVWPKRKRRHPRS